MTRHPKTLAFWVGRLPHWEVEEGRYFITLHVAGAIPAAGRERICRLSEEMGQASVATRGSVGWIEKQRLVFREMERWLDRASHNPILREPVVAAIVAEAIEHRHRTHEWNVFEYVVMPTHLHLFCEVGPRGLKNSMETFKRWTATQVLAHLRSSSRTRLKADVQFWQREWFDHWSRGDPEDDRIVQYIRNNPKTAGLVSCIDEWPFASWSRREHMSRSK